MYIPMGDKQESTKSDLAGALNDLIDAFDLTPQDHTAILEILNDHEITFEA